MNEFEDLLNSVGSPSRGQVMSLLLEVLTVDANQANIYLLLRYWVLRNDSA